MNRQVRELWYDLQCARAIRHANTLPYYAQVLNEEGVLQARQLIAAIYVQKGVIPANALQEDGTMSEEVDPYWRHSTYIGVRSRLTPKRLLMAARLIHPTASQGLASLQLHLDQLRPAFLRQLRLMPAASVAELAAYVKQPGLDPLESRLCSLYLVRALVFESRRQNIDTWIFGLRPELKTKYERIFGPALDRQGERVQLGHFNAWFIPYSINIERSAKRFLQASWLRPGSRAIATFTAAGVQAIPVETPASQAAHTKPAH